MWILDTLKFKMPFFSGKSLLLSNTVLNDYQTKNYSTAQQLLHIIIGNFTCVRSTVYNMLNIPHAASEDHFYQSSCSAVNIQMTIYLLL